MKTIFWRGLVLMLLFSVQSAMASLIPMYTGGSVISFGQPPLTREDQREVAETVNAYVAKTGNEIGIVLMEDGSAYGPDMPTVLERLTAAKYTPNGWLLVVDFTRREMHLQVSTRVEQADEWTAEESRRVIDEILPIYFANGDIVDGLKAFVAEVEKQVPLSLPVAIHQKEEEAKFALTAERLVKEKGLGTFLWVLGAVLALGLGGWWYWRWRRVRALQAIARWYNELSPMFEADLEALDVHPLGEVGSVIHNHYQQQVQDLQQHLTQWFEQGEKPWSEVRHWYQQVEKLEDGLTQWVNAPEVVVKRRTELESARTAAMQAYTKALDEHEL